MARHVSKKYPVKSSVSKEFLDKIDKEVASEGFNGRGDFANYCMRYYFAVRTITNAYVTRWSF